MSPKLGSVMDLADCDPALYPASSAAQHNLVKLLGLKSSLRPLFLAC